jgi:ribosomal protein S18 acetylase RimI-like enzyme
MPGEAMVRLKVCGRIKVSNPTADGKLAEDYLDYRVGSGGTIEIEDIAVMSERGKGRGTELLNQLISECRDMPTMPRLIWAITRAENEVAQHFYEARGFRVVGVLRDFYHEERPSGRPSITGGIDAIMYGLDL